MILNENLIKGLITEYSIKINLLFKFIFRNQAIKEVISMLIKKLDLEERLLTSKDTIHVLL